MFNYDPLLFLFVSFALIRVLVSCMKFILGTKLNMTQVWSDAGKVVPVTLIATGPIVVTQVKTAEKDGYSSVQVGFGSKNEKNITKAEMGHLKGSGKFALLKEFRDVKDLKVGDEIKPETFAAGDTVTVSAISKGKGFQGVVKRHGFHGGPRSHGQKHSEREPGSIGGGLRNKVPKGMRMAGRMGSDRITIKNLKIVEVNPVENLIAVSGAIPGRRGTLVEIMGS